jgi:hypothetical protein
MSEELKLDLSYYYDLARDLRSSLRDSEQERRFEAARRMMCLDEYESLEAERVLRKKVSLRQTKKVIAIEHSFEDWPDLRVAIEKKIEDIQQHCEGRYFPRGLPAEVGDVVEGDLILLGSFGEKNYVVDAILLTLFEATTCTIGPGVVLEERDAEDFDPAAVPDLPEEDDGWNAWSLATAEVLGVKAP